MGLSAGLVLVGLALGQDAPPPLAASGEPTAAQVQALTERLDQAERRLEATEARLEQAEVRLEQVEGAQQSRAAQSELRPGGRVIEAGTTVPGAVSLGGTLEVRGVVEGDAVALAGDLMVAPGGRIDGDAVAFGGTVRVLPGGEVLGNRVVLGSEASASIATASPNQGAAALSRRLVVLLAFAGAGVLTVGLYPRHVDAVARELRHRPLAAWLLGLVVTVVTGLLALVLTATLIGFPLALVACALLGVAWGLGFVGLCQTLGDLIPTDRVGLRRWSVLGLGVLVISFAGAFPAGLVLTLALATGFACVGAAVATRLGSREPGL